MSALYASTTILSFAQYARVGSWRTSAYGCSMICGKMFVNDVICWGEPESAHLVRSGLDLRGGEQDSEVVNLEVRHADRARETGGLERLHACPRSRDVRLRVPRVVDQVQVHIIRAQLRVAAVIDAVRI